jgi:hypothetical protein
MTQISRSPGRENRDQCFYQTLLRTLEIQPEDSRDHAHRVSREGRCFYQI